MDQQIQINQPDNSQGSPQDSPTRENRKKAVLFTLATILIIIVGLVNYMYS